MKKLLLLVFSVLSISVCMGSQKGFTTSFDISGMADTTQFVIRLHDSEKGFGDSRFDTIPVVNGHGVLADVCRVNHPVSAYAFTPYGVISFFVSNNINEKISGTVQDIENVSLTYEGAPWSEDFIIFNREYEVPMERINNMIKRWSTLTMEEKDSISRGQKNLHQKSDT